MNRLVEPVETHLGGTISVVEMKGPYQDHQELIDAVNDASMRLSWLFPDMLADMADPTLEVHPKIRHDQREGERDPVSTEYIPHLDGAWLPNRPLASLVVARKAGIDPPPTRFYSPIGLF